MKEGGAMRMATFVLLGGLALTATLAEVGAHQLGRASPHESVKATIDGGEITITYGRPSMRGRVIFGRLVPFDRVWCPGADEATTLESTRPLKVGELSVPAGPHTIWVLPTRDIWKLIVSQEPSGFHTNYNASADLGNLEMRKRALDAPVERLTFAIVKNESGPGGSVTMTWETTEVSVPFTVQ
jgi:Protein of unknown function (DUF2911)